MGRTRGSRKKPADPIKNIVRLRSVYNAVSSTYNSEAPNSFYIETNKLQGPSLPEVTLNLWLTKNFPFHEIPSPLAFFFCRPAADSILMPPTFHIARLNRYTPNFSGVPQKLTWCQQFGLQIFPKWGDADICPLEMAVFRCFFGRNKFSRPNGRLSPIACLTYLESYGT